METKKSIGTKFKEFALSTLAVNNRKTVYLVLAILLIGGVTSYLIDEEEGLQNYFYAIDTFTDTEVSQDTKNTIVVTSLKTIIDYYGGGGKQKKQGMFEYYS